MHIYELKTGQLVTVITINAVSAVISDEKDSQAVSFPALFMCTSTILRSLIRDRFGFFVIMVTKSLCRKLRTANPTQLDHVVTLTTYLAI